MIGRGASAPGKALLCGEYAVLEGAPTVVAAVDRRAVAVWAEQPHPLPPEVEATLALVHEQLGGVQAPLRIDVDALRSGDRKLGLGSSAAAAAAAAAAAFEHLGHDLADASVQARIFDCAFAGHAAVAPQGSGVDVAASTFGGFLRFERSGDRVAHRGLVRPSELVVRLIWTGHPARTSDLLKRVHAFRDHEPGHYTRLMKHLSVTAERFADAFEAGDAAAVVEAAAAYGDAMEELGRAAGAPIVEERLRATSTLARRFSGGAKPCGAGGGDVAVAFFVDQESANAFDAACSEANLQPIEVGWGARGVHPYSG